VDGDGDFSFLPGIGLRSQPVTDHPLEPADRGLDTRTLIVAGRLLPTDAATLGDALQMKVTLRRIGLGGLALDRGGSRRHDDGRIGMTLCHRREHIIRIVCAIAGEQRDRPGDLVEQRSDLRGIIDIVRRQLRRHDLVGIGVQADVQLPPGAAFLGAVFLHQPFARAMKLQPRAVHDQVQSTGVGIGPWLRHIQPVCPTGQCGVVGDSKVEAEQADDGADQPLGLPQRQMEHRPQRQPGQNRQRRIMRLPARRGPAFCIPTRNRLLAEPHRQAAELAQTCIIGSPIRHPALLLRDVMATGSLGFERHGETTPG
jgi:hypothetical protein